MLLQKTRQGIGYRVGIPGNGCIELLQCRQGLPFQQLQDCRWDRLVLVHPRHGLFLQPFAQALADVGRHLDHRGGVFGDALALAVGEALIALAPGQLQAQRSPFGIERIHIQRQAGGGEFNRQPAVAIAGMQFQRLAGVKAEVVDVGAGAGTGAFVHPHPLGVGDRFTIIDQLRWAEFGLGAAIEIGPPAHLGFAVVERQQLSQQPVGPPAHPAWPQCTLICQVVGNLFEQLLAEQL